MATLKQKRTKCALALKQLRDELEIERGRAENQAAEFAKLFRDPSQLSLNDKSRFLRYLLDRAGKPLPYRHRFIDDSLHGTSARSPFVPPAELADVFRHADRAIADYIRDQSSTLVISFKTRVGRILRLAYKAGLLREPAKVIGRLTLKGLRLSDYSDLDLCDDVVSPLLNKTKASPVPNPEWCEVEQLEIVLVGLIAAVSKQPVQSAAKPGRPREEIEAPKLAAVRDWIDRDEETDQRTMKTFAEGVGIPFDEFDRLVNREQARRRRSSSRSANKMSDK